jgi:RNA polymerase-interacting CarD/CdnL/TRCF family regulator
MFEVGEKIYHPNKGLCEIKTVFIREENAVYMLKPVHSPKKLQRFELNQKKAAQIGVHFPISKEEVEKIIMVLDQKPHNIVLDRNEDYKNTKEKLYSGDLFKIAEAVRDLEALKDLLFSGEKRSLLKLGKNTLIKGLSHASGKTRKQIEASLEKSLCIYRDTISDGK